MKASRALLEDLRARVIQSIVRIQTSAPAVIPRAQNPCVVQLIFVPARLGN